MMVKNFFVIFYDELDEHDNVSFLLKWETRHDIHLEDWTLEDYLSLETPYVGLVWHTSCQ